MRLFAFCLFVLSAGLVLAGIGAGIEEDWSNFLVLIGAAGFICAIAEAVSKAGRRTRVYAPRRRGIMHFIFFR